MNAFSTTTRDLARALLGRPRAQQTVHVSTQVFNGNGLVRALVLVVPEGAEQGTRYEVFSPRVLEELKAGASPEWLELEPYEEEEA